MESLSEVWTWFAACVVFVGVGFLVKPVARSAHARFHSEATRLFLETMPRHPLVAGILLGLFVPDVPAATFVGDHPIAKALYYGSAGVLCPFVYDAARKRLKQRLARDSTAGES